MWRAVLYTTADGVGLAATGLFRRFLEKVTVGRQGISVIYRYLLLCPSAILPAYVAVLYSSADGVWLCSGRLIPPGFR